MENTPENKAKFFAQYWGQKVFTHPEYDTTEIDYVTDFSFGFMRRDIDTDKKESYYLELKPLSQISDEDAIEVAKILIEHDKNVYDRRFSIQPRGSFNLDNDVLSVLVEIYSEHPFNKGWLKQGLVQIDTEDHNVVEAYFEGGSSSFFDMSSEHSFCVLDYLRSKGYALPWNGITILQQIEYGWVKFKTINI